ncbi:hypothetical protein C1645_809133 [Glomus cerebriforme]|uniref:Kelch repeat protein n=1 Tax=Glomus cerebriforme TaxID=658196 RepID=A0A397SBC9_9GLOM|nr:hypothetical protein C1645_809133 [Glomus cerebriforme]
MFITSILIISLALTSVMAAYYSPTYRTNAASFLIGDRLFYTGGDYATDLFYLELGQGPFQLTDPPFQLVQNNLPNLYPYLVGGSVVIGQTAFIFVTNEESNFLRIDIGPNPVSYKFINRNETKNPEFSPGMGNPLTVVDKNGLIYMWFTPIKVGGVNNGDENLYIFNTVNSDWSLVKPPRSVINPDTAVILSDGRIIFLAGVYDQNVATIYDTTKGTWYNQTITGNIEFGFECSNGKLYNEKILCIDTFTNKMNELDTSSFSWSVHDILDPSNSVVLPLVVVGAVDIYQDWMIFSFCSYPSSSDNRVMNVVSLANGNYEWISNTGMIPLVKDPNESSPPQPVYDMI